MSKTTVIGNALIVQSDLTTEQIQTVAKFRPSALAIYEGDGAEKIQVFAIGTGKTGSISKFGITFDGTSRDEGKFATVTLPYAGSDNPKEWVAETYGSALARLNEIEKQIPNVVKEAQDAKAAILAGITVG